MIKRVHAATSWIQQKWFLPSETRVIQCLNSDCSYCLENYLLYIYLDKRGFEVSQHVLDPPHLRTHLKCLLYVGFYYMCESYKLVMIDHARLTDCVYNIQFVCSPVGRLSVCACNFSEMVQQQFKMAGNKGRLFSQLIDSYMCSGVHRAAISTCSVQLCC